MQSYGDTTAPTANSATWATATYAYAGNTDQLAGATYSSNWKTPPATDSSYTYDATGNRVTTAATGTTQWTTGTDNQLTYDGTYYYFYDAEGNRIAKFQSTDAPTDAHTIPSDAMHVTTYTWDNRNRLTSVSYQGTEVQYKYDAFDRLVAKDVTTASGTTSERYVYDGDNLVLVLAPNGTVIDRYLNGPAVDQVLAEEDTSGTVSWMLADNEGSVRDVAVYSSGQTNITDHLTYDAFGNLTGQTPGATAPRFTYAGRQYDADAGLYYNRARWYDASTGRFISEDSLGFGAGDVNLSRYCGNSPVNATDPSGRLDIDPGMTPQLPLSTSPDIDPGMTPPYNPGPGTIPDFRPNNPGPGMTPQFPVYNPNPGTTPILPLSPRPDINPGMTPPYNPGPGTTPDFPPNNPGPETAPPWSITITPRPVGVGRGFDAEDVDGDGPAEGDAEGDAGTTWVVGPVRRRSSHGLLDSFVEWLHYYFPTLIDGALEARGVPVPIGTVIGGLEVAGEALQPDNIENYYRKRRDCEVEGSDDWNYWNDRLQNCRRMRSGK